MSVQSVFQSVRNQSFYGVKGKQRLHNSSKGEKYKINQSIEIIKNLI